MSGRQGTFGIVLAMLVAFVLLETGHGFWGLLVLGALVVISLRGPSSSQHKLRYRLAAVVEWARNRALLGARVRREFSGSAEGSMAHINRGRVFLGGLLAGGFASTALHGFHATFAGMSFGPLDTIFTAIGLLMIGAGWYGMIFLTRAVKD